MQMINQEAVDNPLNVGNTITRPRTAWAASLAGTIGGVLLFMDLALHAFRPLGQSYFIIAAVMALCMPFVPVALWRRHAIQAGWRRGLAAVGTGLVMLGAAAWVAAFVLLFNRPEYAFTQHLTPGGSALMALGMIVFGTAVLASRRIKGLGAVLPLLVGVYFPLQLVAQILFFLNGKDGSPGPNGAVLGAWGLVWAAAAWSGAETEQRIDAGFSPDR